MIKIKVIDLLNKIANGEEIPKKIRIDHWCYMFEWKDYAGNYVDEHEDIDLMSALSCDKEELNYEVHELKEDKKIEKLKQRTDTGLFGSMVNDEISVAEAINKQANYISDIVDKINEIIDYLEENK